MFFWILGCSGTFELASRDDAGSGGDTGFQDGTGGLGGGTASDTDHTDGYEPEDEDTFPGLPPAATNAYVFVANPDRDTVTRISVPSLEVVTVEVGAIPIGVATTSDYSAAASFNVGDDTISIIDSATMTVTQVPVRGNLNRMEISPDGRWVLAFHDTSIELEYEPTPVGTSSFNEMSVVSLDSGVVTDLVIGYSPKDLAFTPDGSAALLVSDATLSVLDLSGDEINDPERIDFVDDVVDPPSAEEVLLTPNGRFAFVRQFGVSDLVLVDLQDKSKQLLAVGDNPTDLDLSIDGSQAIAVARGSHELWVYDVADPAGVSPEVITFPSEELFGSLVMTPDGRRGLLYTTASTDTTHVGLWSLSDDTVEVRALVKPVSAVSVAPDGETMLVIHPEANGPDITSDSGFWNKHALSMVQIDSGLTNALALQAEPIGYANADDGSTGFFVMEDVPEITALDYTTLLAYPQPLASNPVFLGTLPDANTAWISQEHDLGRISFYSPPDQMQTLTGFELNSAIEVE